MTMWRLLPWAASPTLAQDASSSHVLLDTNLPVDLSASSSDTAVKLTKTTNAKGNIDVLMHAADVKIPDWDCVRLDKATSLVDWGFVARSMPFMMERNYTRMYEIKDIVSSSCPHRFGSSADEWPLHEAWPRTFQFIVDNWHGAMLECPMGAFAVNILNVLCHPPKSASGINTAALETMWHASLKSTKSLITLSGSRWRVAMLLHNLQLLHMTAFGVVEDKFECAEPHALGDKGIQLYNMVWEEEMLKYEKWPGIFGRINKILERLGGPFAHLNGVMQTLWDQRRVCLVLGAFYSALQINAGLMYIFGEADIEGYDIDLMNNLVHVPFSELISSRFAIFSIIGGWQHLMWRSLNAYTDFAPVTVTHSYTAAKRHLSHLGHDVDNIDVAQTMFNAPASTRAAHLLEQSQSNPRPVARGLAKYLYDTRQLDPGVVVYSAVWGTYMGRKLFTAFIKRAQISGIERLIMIYDWSVDYPPTSGHQDTANRCRNMTRDWRLDNGASALYCLGVAPPGKDYERIHGPYDKNNQAKFEYVPFLLSLGIRLAWLDADIYLFQDPSPYFIWQSANERADILVQEHWDTVCINHGIIFNQPTDDNVVFYLRYIEWLHKYLFSHDQDGFDAFLGHSGTAPFVPKNGHGQGEKPYINYGILDIEQYFPQADGFHGDPYRAYLIHFTGLREDERIRLMRHLADCTVSGDADPPSLLLDFLVTVSKGPPPKEKRQYAQCMAR